MTSFVCRRLLGVIPTLLVIVTLSFFLMRLAPGGPFDTQRRLPPEIQRNIAAAYDLDKPLYEQYFIYLDQLVHFDLGPSYRTKDFTVSELIADGLPVSARLGLSAMAIALVFGITLGALAALRQNSTTDYGVMSFAMFGITIPSFVTAPLLMLIFGVWGVRFLGHDISLPVGGWNGGALANLVLPVTVLALPEIAIVARLVRGTMVEVLRSNFIRTARAKGLPEHLIVLRHALPTALLPLISYLGPAFATLLTGSLVVERIFGIPGIGRYFVEGAINRDYTLVLGVVIFYATFILLLNLLADVLYAVLDPRVRYQ
ncbi:MAG TPA: oligopeptide ABC transporter permease OppB [Rhizomicrobium sp.]|jgi:oligopeptide transport system permease protein|nr:oligopeptide ABC transporter permease OppB [Rhizomicrobium sp.]